MRALSDAYLAFARESPHVFALTLAAPAEGDDENAMHLQCWRFVTGQVSRLYGEKQAPEASVALWALMHGMCVLEQAGVLGELKPGSGGSFGLQIWIAAAGEQASQASPS
ncbi:TetR-like C-terminal domain-containing protein [Pantoea sp. BAV 3049]|uniref:TetR-like C-terminal domain-containing protein n=1 Tax=Pantoea sp. BAV 3049 TaxID=2654188 RepID=UPI00131D7CBC